LSEAPPRVSRGLGCIVCGPPGVGKTTFAYEWPKPVNIISMYETGTDDFEYQGLVPAGVQNFNVTKMEDVNSLMKSPCKTLIIDSLTGFQQVYFDYLIRTFYGGESKKFYAYYTGPRMDAPIHLLPILNHLSTLLQRGTNVVLLAHQVTDKIENSMGQDYLKAEIDIDEGIRNSFYKWAPNILYMALENTINKERVSEGTPKRLIYTNTSLQHCAKNKIGLPSFINMGESPAEAFKNFWDKVPAVYKQ
jgi:hypothetical protein